MEALVIITFFIFGLNVPFSLTGFHDGHRLLKNFDMLFLFSCTYLFQYAILVKQKLQ